MVLLDVGVKLRARRPGCDEAVARLVALVVDGVPETLRVDDQLSTSRQRDAVLDARVGAVLTQDEVAVLVIGQVEEPTNYPTGAVGVEAVVVVLVEVVEAVGVRVRLQLDDAAPSHVRAWLLRPGGEGWCKCGLGIDPDAVLVGTGRLVVPEAVALDLALGRGKRCETSVTRGLPIHVLDVEPFLRIDRIVVAVEDDKAGLVESGALDVTHRVCAFRSVSQRVFTGPT